MRRYGIRNFILLWFFKTAVVLKRFKTPTRIPSMNATQEEINNIVKINDGKNDYEFYRYEVVTETDAEPGEIKIILLKSSEGIITDRKFAFWMKWMKNTITTKKVLKFNLHLMYGIKLWSEKPKLTLATFQLLTFFKKNSSYHRFDCSQNAKKVYH